MPYSPPVAPPPPPQWRNLGNATKPTIDRRDKRNRRMIPRAPAQTILPQNRYKGPQIVPPPLPPAPPPNRLGGPMGGHIIREPGVKIRARGPQVQYGDYTLVNPNAVYPNNDKGSPEYWQSVDMGYKPTYWEDPRHVAVAYQRLKSLLPGEPPPDWMDSENIEAAYKYLSYANGEESWTKWKYLAPDDPGRQFLQQIAPPPLEEVLQPEQYEQIQFSKIINTAPEVRIPEEVAQLSLYHQNALAQYDAYNQNQKFINEHTPGWMRLTQSIMDNPIAAGMVQTRPMAAITVGATGTGG